jgi:rubredoxin
MSESVTRECPSCGEPTEFWLTASTLVHLGEKTKWRCSECNYAFVLVGDVDTSASATAD